MGEPTQDATGSIQKLDLALILTSSYKTQLQKDAMESSSLILSFFQTLFPSLIVAASGKRKD